MTEQLNKLDKSVRIDKWLWAVRIYKTRSEASEACRLNRVLLNGRDTKPAHELKVGDIITVKRTSINFIYKVLGLIQNRQAPKNVSLYVQDMTPPEEVEEIKLKYTLQYVQRDKGTGRPTKKDRRDMEDFING